MAKKKNAQSNSAANNASMQTHTDSFVKGMVQDTNESFRLRVLGCMQEMQ